MAQSIQTAEMPGHLLEQDGSGDTLLFLYGPADVLLAGDEVRRQELQENNVIREWCSQAARTKDELGQITRTFDALTAGQRVYHAGLMHGGFLHEGKEAVLVASNNPQALTPNDLYFLLPVEVGDNPGKIKNLPIPNDQLLTGDDAILESLMFKLMEPTVSENSIFQVTNYIRVVRSMKSLGWEVSGEMDGTLLDEIRGNIRSFAENSINSWIDDIEQMPKSVLECLFELSALLGDHINQAAIDTIATYYAECVTAEDDTRKKIGEKAVAAFTTFWQKHAKDTHFTRQKARDELVKRGEAAISRVNIPIIGDGK